MWHEHLNNCGMMKIKNIFLHALLLFLFFGCSQKEKSAPQWKMGIQTYTFNQFTLKEALEKTRDLGLNYAEAYFFQELGDVSPDTAWLNFDLPAHVLENLREEYRKHDIVWYASGVAFYDNEADWNRFFEFASQMDLKVVTAEPQYEDLDLVEELAQKYKIRVAIHNHPEPSLYANPDTLLKVLEGRSEFMGVCADIGHWKRVGADPLETIKRCKGKLMVVHMKDINAQLQDTIWGTGILPLREIVQELYNQDFDGLISVEYENYESTLMYDISESLKYFKSITEELNR